MINNYSIKTKLFSIFFFAVLIPMLTSNLIIYNNISNNIIKEQKDEMKAIIQRVVLNLDRVMQDSISVSNQLYRSKVVDDFISMKYEDPIEFYEGYMYMLDNNFLRYYYNSQNEYSITIYTDNETISNSSDMVKLTSKIKRNKWYKDFINSNKKVNISSSYNEDGDIGISLVKKLDYFSYDNEKILKIDMNYNSILKEIISEYNNFGVDIYICNDKHILFSNNELNSNKLKVSTIDEIIPKDILLEQEYEINGYNGICNIIVTAEKDIYNKIFNNNKIKLIIICLLILNLLIPTIVILMVSYSITNRLSLLTLHLKKVKNGEFDTIDNNVGKDEIGSVMDNFNLMVVKIEDLIDVILKKDIEQKELELAKNRAELKALQSQINPHFMFNTLESIRMRSLIKGEEETAFIIENLAKLLRQTINWGEDNIKISDEIGFVNNYLAIQKYRFGDRLDFNVNILPICNNIRIPKLSILTFVENSCIHGMEGVAYNVQIGIDIIIEDDYLYICIADNGKGISVEKLNEIQHKINNCSFELINGGRGLGLLNVYMRLQRYSNNTMKFNIESNESYGTTIKIQLPVSEDMRCL
ncbi:sensor histidine kinase [Clostridium disporicum]|uniref:histidine kinase n=2 Tax=Clostridium TaxID=1485 RepID=A0A174G9N6_9CLOT|nr:histidine kinase [Clostridium disporicum]CUO59123.1 sensor histidine kinase YesM [Clostridium disporicum]